GHGKNDNRGLVFGFVAKRFERHVRRLQRVLVAGHRGFEGGVNDPLEIRTRAKTGPQGHAASARRLQHFVYVLINPDIGAPESIDGLLRIAYQKELPGNGASFAPACRRRTVGSEKQQDLGLKWIGVLELVHEDSLEAL